jgi:hypothetical protein
MLRVHVAHSEDPDTASAVAELLDTLARQARGPGLAAPAEPNALLVFAAIGHDHAALLGRLADAWPGAALLGCTTAGEASLGLGLQEDSIVVAALADDAVTFTAGLGRDMARDPAAAARAAVAQARAATPLPPRLALAFPDSLTTSGVAIVDSLQAELGPAVTLLGGTAGDQFRFERTYQFFGREVLTDTVPVLLISGPLRFGTGVASGWRPVGRPVRVTRAEANVVYTLGDTTTLAFYRSYLGPGAAPMGEYALAVFEPDGGRYHLRAPFSFSDADGSITFAGDVPVGALVQLTDVDRAGILAAARASLAHALADYDGDAPQAALFFSCAGRKTTLGSAADREMREIEGLLAADVPIVGFYAYGEIGPLERGGPARFHNQTFVSLLLGS